MFICPLISDFLNHLQSTSASNCDVMFEWYCICLVLRMRLHLSSVPIILLMHPYCTGYCIATQKISRYVILMVFEVSEVTMKFYHVKIYVFLQSSYCGLHVLVYAAYRQYHTFSMLQWVWHSQKKLCLTQRLSILQSDCLYLGG